MFHDKDNLALAYQNITTNKTKQRTAASQILLRHLGSRLNDITASTALVMGWSGSREWALGIGIGCALRTQIDGLGNNSKFESYEKPLKTLHNISSLRACTRYMCCR